MAKEASWTWWFPHGGLAVEHSRRHWKSEVELCPGAAGNACNRQQAFGKGLWLSAEFCPVLKCGGQSLLFWPVNKKESTCKAEVLLSCEASAEEGILSIIVLVSSLRRAHPSLCLTICSLEHGLFLQRDPAVLRQWCRKHLHRWIFPF